MSDQSVSVEEEAEPMQMVSSLILRSESQDLIVNQQARIAEMQYSQHEFVKMNEVSRLIHEALEQVFDRFQKKDKLLNQHKMQLRQQDTKLKQMEQNVVSLMKMTPQHNAVFKQIKDFKSDIEKVLKERDHDKQSLDYVISAVNLRINNSNQAIDQLRSQLDHHEQRWLQSKLDALKVSEGIDERIMKSKDEMQHEFNKLEGQYRELGVQNEKLVQNYDRLQGDILKQNSVDVARIVESIRIDADRVFKIESQMRELLKMQDQLQSVDVQSKYLTSRVEEARMCQQYVETILPLQIHVQCLQAVSFVVTTETQQTQLQQYDIEQLRAFKPLSLQDVKNKYLQLAKFCRDLGEGSCQIDLNADFNPAFVKMQIDHHKQLIQKQISVETINREQMVSRMLKEQEKQQPKIMQTAQKRPNVIARQLTISEPRQQNIKVEQPLEPPQIPVPALIAAPVLAPATVTVPATTTVTVPAPTTVTVPATTTVVEQKIVTNNITNTTIQNKLVTITKTDLKSQQRLQLQFKHLNDSMKRQMRSLKQTVIDCLTEILQDWDRFDQKQEYQSKQILQIVMFLQSPSNKPQDLTKQIEKIQKQLVSIERKPVTRPPPQPPTPPPQPAKQQFSSKQLLKFQDEIKESVTESMQQFHKNIDEFNYKLDVAQQELQMLATTLKMQVEVSMQEALNKQALASQQQSMELEQKCYDTFKDLEQRQSKLEALCRDQEGRTLEVIQLQEEFTELFKRDYNQFVTDRKRWKADFSIAAQTQIKNVEELQGYVQQSLRQQQSISKVLKLMNDAQMIQQLIETQDFEDKKRIGLLGAEAIKVDKGCLQCSGNQSQVVHQLKLACMGYSQTPITYKEQQYYVGDLIKTKGKVVAQTQRVLRDALEKTELVNYNDERSYIIEQMLQVQPIVQPSTVMKIQRDDQNVIVHTHEKMRPKSVLDSQMLKTMYSSIPSVPDWTQSRLVSHDAKAEIKTRNIKRVLTMTQQPVKF